MPFVPRTASPRRSEPRVAQEDLGAKPAAIPDRRPEATKLATPDAVKSPSSKVEPHAEPSGDVMHPVDGNPAACPGPACEECFPDGVESGSSSVGCQHGMWVFKLS